MITTSLRKKKNRERLLAVLVGGSDGIRTRDLSLDRAAC
jgi:hypothetical protein